MERSVLQEKLSQPFDSSIWKEVVEGVFHHVSYFAKERSLPAGDENVDSFVETGTVQLKDGRNLALFEVRVADSVNLPRARVKLRNLVAKHIDQQTHYGVLAIFDQGGEDYRLSFVAKESELVDGEFLTKETPAKRYTYLLGSNESCRTAAERLAALSEKTEASLDDIIDAFSVEKLNKEFYRDIQKYFYGLVGGKVETKDYTGCMTLPSLPIDQPENHKTYQEFAVRLIGRVIFCWFLKHKRCDKDRPLIPEELLSSKAIEEHVGYYHNILEKLFFQTLNMPMNERSKYAPEFAHLIPYLNGGLFDPKSHDFYEEGELGASLHLNTLKIPDEWFLNLFLCLEQYNFTIDENTSLDNDVSIDPEILGRIFENLLAEINPETGDSARKATGSFYTPREIVDYMVEESLVQHLKTAIAQDEEMEQKFRALFVDDDQPHGLDEGIRKVVVEAFRTIKVLDPACGSGAFPVGILQKMLCALRKVDPDNGLWLDAQFEQIHTMKLDKREEDRRLDEIEHAFETNEADYGRKLGIIQNSVYGVDIQPVAIEIAKLRFFLTLVVDEKINDDEDNRGILPLPNLDFKFVAANTLIPAPDIPDLGKEQELGLEYEDTFFDDFTVLTEKYFYAGDPQTKHDIREQLEAVVSSKVKEELDKGHKLTEGIWDSTFDGAEKMAASLRKKYKKKIEELGRNAALWDSYKNIFTGDSIGFFDPQYMFPDAAGFDIVIGNPPYGAKLSKEEKVTFLSLYEKQSYQLDTYLLFTERAFQLCRRNAVVSLIIPNTWLINLLSISVRKWIISELSIVSIIHYRKAVFEAVVDSEVVIFQNKPPEKNHSLQLDVVHDRHSRDVSIVPQEQWSALNGEPINVLQTPDVFELVNKMRRSEKLDDLCKITQGTKPFQVGKGRPKQTREIVNAKLYVSEIKVDETFLPLLRGKLMNRYAILWQNNYWISFGDWLAEPRYSAGYDSASKIIIRQTGDSLVATLDESQFIVRDNLYTIVPVLPKVDLHAILGLINSKLLNWYYQNALNSEQGEALAQVKRGHLARLPIVISDQASVSAIINLVADILDSRKNTPEADVSALEAEIDQLVYKLYDLTSEEISIVEGVD